MVDIPRPPAPEVRINLSPLIDVVFILLVFVVLVAKFVDLERVDVDVPTSAAGEKQTKMALLVQVQEDGTVTIAEREVEKAEYRGLLKRLRDAHDRVVIVADKSVHLERVVDVLSAARLEGYEQVAIATAPPRETTSAETTPASSGE